MTATAEPRVPFPSATGKGVKIAVIDSGVNIRHPHIVSPSTFGVVLASDEARNQLGRSDWTWDGGDGGDSGEGA